MFGRPAAMRWFLLVALSASLSQAQFFSPDGVAKVAQLTGQVSVLRDSQPWALKVGDAIQLRQVVVTGPDGFAVFQLSDGSTFEVYPNSRFTFRNTPGNLRDLLDLWMGRVKVHIQKLGGEPNHNRVRTPTAVISVRGTVFYVTVEDELDTTLVVVEEGQVAVEHLLLPRGEAKILNAGEYIRVYRNQPLAQKMLDKGSAVQQGLRALADVFYSILWRGGGVRTAGPGSAPVPTSAPTPVPGGGPPLPGDTEPDPPPPPPPPPPGP